MYTINKILLTLLSLLLLLLLLLLLQVYATAFMMEFQFFTHG